MSILFLVFVIHTVSACGGDYPFTCVSKGRFADPTDSTCNEYFLCSELLNGTHLQTQYTCPIGSLFNPGLHRCSTSYKCPCLETTTEVFVSTECSNSGNNSKFTCTEPGRFYNPRDLTCSRYFLCSALRNGTILQTEYICPNKTVFNPSTHLCSTLYKCPCQNSTRNQDFTSTVESTTTITNKCPVDVSYVEDFICVEQGRFPNNTDSSCINYYLCSALLNGTFIRTDYTCPMGSVFDPGSQRCSTSYECPCPSMPGNLQALNIMLPVTSSGTLKESVLLNANLLFTVVVMLLLR